MSKKQKIIISFIITIILIVTSIFTYKYLTKNNKKLNEQNQVNDNNKSQENIEYTYTDNGPAFFCSDEQLGSKPISYMIGEYVYCTISYELNGENPGIREIWMEYSMDENIEHIETINASETEWTLEENDNKIHLVTNRPTVYAEYFYQAKFRIKPTTTKEKVNITFKNIRYKDEENNYYKIDDSIHELTVDKITNYYYKKSKINDEITFYKLNKTDGYEEINKYTCESESCFEYASQCTGYVDLDRGKLLIHDGNMSVLYDFNKGVIGKYSSEIEDLDKYFIVKDIKTEKYGIIDKDGKIIR